MLCTQLDVVVSPLADHRECAGARFDVKTKGPYEILVSSLWAGGMMGSITVWACDQAWCGDDDSQRRSSSCKLPRYCWHLGCILSKSASNDRASRGPRLRHRADGALDEDRLAILPALLVRANGGVEKDRCAAFSHQSVFTPTEFLLAGTCLRRLSLTSRSGSVRGSCGRCTYTRRCRTTWASSTRATAPMTSSHRWDATHLQDERLSGSLWLSLHLCGCVSPSLALPLSLSLARARG